MLGWPAIDSAMSELEYSPLQGAAGATHRYFMASSSSADVEHLVLLRFAERQLKLLGGLALRNEIAERFSCEAIKRFGPLMFGSLDCRSKASTFIFFDFEAWRDTPMSRGISLVGRDAASCLAVLRLQITDFVTPAFQRIRSLRDFLNLLSTNESPFGWRGQNAAIRSAQIVAIMKRLGASDGEVIDLIVPYYERVKYSLVDVDPRRFIQHVCEFWPKFLEAENER